ncbi:MAG: sugar-binding transcriptional regulator [Chloroflexi bacterium]|nr:sugar-binding transcriptional regulator [Chloroflexota bacterium]
MVIHQNLKPNPNIDPEELYLLLRIANLYYENNLTQDQIGQKLGYSRVSIHRFLDRAVKLGLVKFLIHDPGKNFINLENQLIVKFNLRDVVVVPDPYENISLYTQLARGAAKWIEKKLHPGIRIGLGLSRTISHIPQEFHPSTKTECFFTEVVGSASDHSDGVAKYNVTANLAEIAGGIPEIFYSPNYVSDENLHDMLMRETTIINSIERAKKCNIVLQSIGTVDDNAILYTEGLISKTELERLEEKNVIGDILGHYFNNAGELVPTFMDRRVVGIDPNELKKIEWSVLVAGGDDKKKPIRAILKNSFFNVLITNHTIAEQLLNED